MLPVLGFALYAHMAAQIFWLNAFGWERGGGRIWFLAPVGPAEILVAKNLTAYGFSAALFAAAGAAAVAVGGPLPGWAVAAAVALHAGVAPWLLAAGNFVSVLNPRAAANTVQRGGSLSPLSSLAGMVIVSGAGAAFAIPAVLAVRRDAPWLLVGGWAALGLAGAIAYRVALPFAAALVARRREPLLAAVAGDEPEAERAPGGRSWLLREPLDEVVRLDALQREHHGSGAHVDLLPHGVRAGVVVRRALRAVPRDVPDDGVVLLDGLLEATIHVALGPVLEPLVLQPLVVRDGDAARVADDVRDDVDLAAPSGRDRRRGSSGRSRPPRRASP